MFRSLVLALFLVGCVTGNPNADIAVVCSAYKDSLRTLVVFQSSLSASDKVLLKRADRILYPGCKTAAARMDADINALRNALREIVLLEQKVR